MNRIMKFLSEHPIKALAILGVSSVLLAVIMSQLPVWVVILFECSLIVFLLVCWKLYSKKIKNEERKMNSLSLEDFKRMYLKYETLVEEQIRLQNYDRELISENWLKNYHELFYIASKMLYRTKFTDFHIAACMMFALVWRDSSLNHVRFVYDCVNTLISKPSVYIRHVSIGGMITLETEETWQEVNLSSLDKVLPPYDICKIIKEVYIHNKNEQTLIELADFLKRLYNRCH